MKERESFSLSYRTSTWVWASSEKRRKKETNVKSLCRYFGFVSFCLTKLLMNEPLQQTKNKLVSYLVRKNDEATNEVEILPTDTE